MNLNTLILSFLGIESHKKSQLGENVSCLNFHRTKPTDIALRVPSNSVAQRHPRQAPSLQGVYDFYKEIRHTNEEMSSNTR